MDYKILVAWNGMMGAYRFYTEDELRLARQDNAPDNVIYWRTREQLDASVRHGLITEDDISDPEQYFRGRSGRIWARYNEETVPVSTRQAMGTNLRRIAAGEIDDPTRP